jgi:hypothetical protein
MSIVIEGIYKQEGQADTIVPLKVDSTGRLETTATATVSSEVEIKNDSGNAIPTEPLGIPTVARQVTVTTTSANTALTAGVKRISIKARTCDMRFAVGSTAQTANATTSHFIEAGERLDIAVPATANIAVIRDSAATANGVLCITELG